MCKETLRMACIRYSIEANGKRETLMHVNFLTRMETYQTCLPLDKQ